MVLCSFKGGGRRCLPPALHQPGPAAAPGGAEDGGWRMELARLLSQSGAKYETLSTRNQIETVSPARTQVMTSYRHTPSRGRRQALSVQFLPQPLWATVFPFQCSILLGKGFWFYCSKTWTRRYGNRFCSGYEIHTKRMPCNSSGCFSVPATVILLWFKKWWHML